MSENFINISEIRGKHVALLSLCMNGTDYGVQWVEKNANFRFLELYANQYSVESTNRERIVIETEASVGQS